MPVHEMSAIRAVRAGTAVPTASQLDHAKLSFLAHVAREATATADSRDSARLKRRPRRLVLVLAAIVTLLVATGAAATSGLLSSEPASTIDQSKDLGQADNIFGMSIFSEPSTLKLQGSEDERAIQRAIGGSGSGSLAATLDVSLARSMPIDGSDRRIWVIPNHKDELCVFLPSSGGFNSSCSGVEVVRKSGLIGISYDGDARQIYAYEVAPDGAHGLTVKSTDDSTREVPLKNNVAATVVSITDVVTNGVATYNVGKMVHPIE